jgi:hypothetical protein
MNRSRRNFRFSAFPGGGIDAPPTASGGVGDVGGEGGGGGGGAVAPTTPNLVSDNKNGLGAEVRLLRLLVVVVVVGKPPKKGALFDEVLDDDVGNPNELGNDDKSNLIGGGASASAYLSQSDTINNNC